MPPGPPAAIVTAAGLFPLFFFQKDSAQSEIGLHRVDIGIERLLEGLAGPREEVAAAVVLKGEATEREIRDFALERLADFKCPRKVVILDEIPKGATGKLQRIGLAEKLGLAPEAAT